MRGSLDLFDDNETNKESLPPSDTEIKNDTTINSDDVQNKDIIENDTTINSDDVQYKDIIENDTNDFTVSNPLLNRRPNVKKEEINEKNPLFDKKPTISMEKSVVGKKKNDTTYQGSTASSRARDVRSRTIGGSKHRRVGTRKNKKKTKTMRRNRRIL